MLSFPVSLEKVFVRTKSGATYKFSASKLLWSKIDAEEMKTIVVSTACYDKQNSHLEKQKILTMYSSAEESNEAILQFCYLCQRPMMDSVWDGSYLCPFHGHDGECLKCGYNFDDRRSCLRGSLSSKRGFMCFSPGNLKLFVLTLVKNRQVSVFFI